MINEFISFYNFYKFINSISYISQNGNTYYNINILAAVSFLVHIIFSKICWLIKNNYYQHILV